LKSFIKWAWVTALKLGKTPYPLTIWGARLILASMPLGIIGSLGVFTISFFSGSKIESIQYIAQEASIWGTIFSIISALAGLALIYKEWEQKTRHTAKIIIASLPNSSTEFPEKILDPAEKAYFREAIILGKNNGNLEDIEAQVLQYNAERTVDIFNRFILHENCERLYIGGLARIPILVAYGSFLKNTYAEINYFDKIHKNGNWSLLHDENLEIGINIAKPEKQVTTTGDIGLAIGFSSEIQPHQLPKDLQESTRILVSNVLPERNLIKNQENLNEIVDQINQHIDEFSKKEGVNKIHLFLSVQTTVALALGRRYQEGMHKNWVIHNYDASESIYNWSIELSKEGIELIKA